MKTTAQHNNCRPVLRSFKNQFRSTFAISKTGASNPLFSIQPAFRLLRTILRQSRFPPRCLLACVVNRHSNSGFDFDGTAKRSHPVVKQWLSSLVPYAFQAVAVAVSLTPTMTNVWVMGADGSILALVKKSK